MNDEAHIIQEFVKEVPDRIADVLKIDPPKPDYQANLISDNKKIKLFIEITQIREADKKTVTTNKTKEQFCNDLRKLLTKKLESIKHGHVVVTVTIKKLPVLKEREKTLETLANKVIGELQNPTTRDGFFNGHNLSLPIIDWLSVKHASSPNTIPNIVVIANVVFIYADNMAERLTETIKDKEAKNYRKHVGNEQLWLVIRIEDGVSTLADLQKLTLAYTSSVFNRIYVQLEYWPETQNYPVKKLQ